MQLRAAKDVLFLVGPTGSGKSALGVKLARKLGGEIVSCDSMQIYRGMNIGTAKPSFLVRRTVRHHLMDIVPPGKEFSVYEYREKALEAIKAIHRRGKLPIVVGGTGLYVKAVVDGISPQPGKDAGVREALLGEVREKGSLALHRRLAALDAKTAGRIHPNDTKRIVRALEVLALSGRSLSDWEGETVSLEAMGYRCWLFGVKRPREELYRAINRRVELMFRRGLVREARRLIRNGLSPTSMQAIGYGELAEYLKQPRGSVPLAEVREKIQRHTRHYAKRQLTWFRKDRRILWLEGQDREMVSAVARELAHAA
jgi:tRNA dimethylallyltransferase